ncbi:MAG: hypothetical protein ACP5NO_07630 [Thermoplasmata archaeon]
MITNQDRERNESERPELLRLWELIVGGKQKAKTLRLDGKKKRITRLKS